MTLFCRKYVQLLELSVYIVFVLCKMLDFPEHKPLKELVNTLCKDTPRDLRETKFSWVSESEDINSFSFT